MKKIKSVSVLALILISVSVLILGSCQSNIVECNTEKRDKIIQEYKTIIDQIKSNPGNWPLIERLQEERNNKIKQIGC